MRGQMSRPSPIPGRSSGTWPQAAWDRHLPRNAHPARIRLVVFMQPCALLVKLMQLLVDPALDS